jgi:hypothetical protein
MMYFMVKCAICTLTFLALVSYTFRILGGHGRLVGSSHQTMAQISSVDPITEGNILLPRHMQLFWVSSALKRSQKVLKVGGIVKIRGCIFKKMGSTVISRLVL